MNKIRYAKIKKDAEILFYREINKTFRPDVPIPKSYVDFAETLKKLQGKKLKIAKIYDNRICLDYPKYHMWKKMGAVGIDMPKYLVDFPKRKIKKVL